LLAYNLSTNTLCHSFKFPPEIASLEDSFLNDLVVDNLNHMIYITDSGISINSGQDPAGGLIIYNYEKQKVRRILHNHATTNIQPDFWLEINGQKVFQDAPMKTGADGIAISPDFSILAWCPLSSRFYSVFNSPLHSLFSIGCRD